MSIIEQLQTITLVYTMLALVLVALVASCSWVLRTWAWWILAFAFALWGAWRVKGFLQVPSAIMRAQSQGVMPQYLTPDQWSNVIVALLTVALLIVGFGKLRFDLKRIGL